MTVKPNCSQPKTVVESQLFRVESLHLTFANGEIRDYERLVPARPSGGAVLIVPLTAENEVILVTEYAAGIDEYVLGFPKGIIEKGESVCEAANRELQEEVGVVSSSLQVLKTVATSPSYMSGQTAIVLARDLTPSQLPGDEPEPLVVTKKPLAEVGELLQNNAFIDARTMAALWQVQQVLHEQY